MGDMIAHNLVTDRYTMFKLGGDCRGLIRDSLDCIHKHAHSDQAVSQLATLRQSGSSRHLWMPSASLVQKLWWKFTEKYTFSSCNFWHQLTTDTQHQSLLFDLFTSV